MFHAASKIIGFLLLPSTLAMLAVVIGIVRARVDRRAGIRMAATGVAFLFVAGILPVGNILMLPLEQRFPRMEDTAGSRPVAGILILGGFEDGWVGETRGGLALNEAGERLIEAVRLARRHTEARVVFTGGVGSLLRRYAGEVDAADAVGAYLREAGIAAGRIALEGRSRNTHENALFTKALVKPEPGSRWLLVTSAYHMPRAMGVFRAAGFDVEAYPVDYRTRGAADLMQVFDSVPAGLARLDAAAREWIGLAAYRLSGRTSEFFPAP